MFVHHNHDWILNVCKIGCHAHDHHFPFPVNGQPKYPLPRCRRERYNLSGQASRWLFCYLLKALNVSTSRPLSSLLVHFTVTNWYLSRVMASMIRSWCCRGSYLNWHITGISNFLSQAQLLLNSIACRIFWPQGLCQLVTGWLQLLLNWLCCWVDFVSKRPAIELITCIVVLYSGNLMPIMYIL